MEKREQEQVTPAPSHGGGDDPPSAEDIREAFLKLCDTVGGLMTKAGRYEEAAQVAAAAMGVAMPSPERDA